MHPRNLSILDYTYDLPAEKIAHYPLPERDLSRLLVYRNGQINEDIYRNISKHIAPDTLLVFNNTKVVQARLFFETATGAKIEIFCLEPAGNTEMATAMSSKAKVQWKCLVGKSGKWKEKVLQKKTADLIIEATIVEKPDDCFIIELSWQPAHLTFAEVLDEAGVMPIPPYLKRNSDKVDIERYQTVYAKHEGSVAAPTAGLHFTNDVITSLQQNNISVDYVTLHVGAGTFKPVKAATMDGHDMHYELIEVSIATISKLKQHIHKGIIAVGTTSLRTIESLYWMGVKAKLNPGISTGEIEVTQWQPYELEDNIPAYDALNALVEWMSNKGKEKIVCRTQIIIAPPYKLKVASALVTNFHQPQSTLLLLVAAITSEKWRDIYNHALQNNYRFLSYGDGSILYP